MYKHTDKKALSFLKVFKRIVLVIFISVIITGVVLIILVTSIGDDFKLTKYLPSNYFLFNDAWGTNRGAIWKTSIAMIKDSNPLEILIGHGSDTFYYYTSSYSNMLSIVPGKLNNAHNELLTSIFNIGLIGTIAYYGIIISAIIVALRKAKDNPFTLFFAACIVSSTHGKRE